MMYSKLIIKFIYLLDQDWLSLEDEVQSGPVQGFGKKLSSILDTCLSE